MRLPTIPAKWWGIGIFVVVVLVLSRIHPTMEVALHLQTNRLAFSLPETDETPVLIEGLPLTSLTLHNFSPLVLDVENVREGGRSLVASANRIVVKALPSDTDTSIMVQSEADFSLIQLALVSGAHVWLYTDPAYEVHVEVRQTRASRIELGMFGNVTLSMKGMEVLDTQGNRLPMRASQATQTLNITPAHPYLVLEQEGDRSFGLTLDFSQQLKPGQPWRIPLGFDALLPLSHLDFIRDNRGRPETTIRQLWGEPLVPQKQPKQNVYLKVREADRFMLQELRLSENGLECELVGHTSTLLVGKIAPPRTNLVPSWLEYIGKHVVFQTLCKPLGLC